MVRNVSYDANEENFIKLTVWDTAGDDRVSLEFGLDLDLIGELILRV